MWLLAVYVIFVAIGDVIAYGIGLYFERHYPSISLAVFLGMFFAVLWLAWRLALRATAVRS